MFYGDEICNLLSSYLAGNLTGILVISLIGIYFYGSYSGLGSSL